VGRIFSHGELGRLASGERVLEVFATEGEPAWRGEIVVLQGRGSIGAAEVLSSILKDRTGAIAVGQTSFGYAGRLTLTPLSNGAHVLLTDAFYTGPDGRPIAGGLEPDVEVSERTRTFAEKDLALDDLTLQRALDLVAEDSELRDVA
jgi:C-terminal processing protease CtpA/Prc